MLADPHNMCTLSALTGPEHLVNQTAWRRALAGYSRAETRKIRKTAKVFEESGALGHYTMRNLDSDRFLGDAAARDFSNLFLKSADIVDIDAIKTDFIQICRSHGLCGGEIGLKPYPVVLGRAADKS